MSEIVDNRNRDSRNSRIDRQKLRYFGHIMRSDGLEKAIMLGMGEDKRKKGRPRMRWLDEVQELTGLGLDVPDIAFV